MIHFIRAERHKAQGIREKHGLLNPTTLSLRTSDRIAILADNIAVLKGLIKLTTGALRIDHGYIKRDVSLSPPIHLYNIPPNLTVAEGIRFAARLYGVDENRLSASTQFITDIGNSIDRPLNTLPKQKISQVNHAIWLCIGFDCYIFFRKVLPNGDADYRNKVAWAMDHARGHTGLLLFSDKPAIALKTCDYGLVYKNGTLVPFTSISNAVEFFQS